MIGLGRRDRVPVRLKVDNEFVSVLMMSWNNAGAPDSEAICSSIAEYVHDQTKGQ